MNKISSGLWSLTGILFAYRETIPDGSLEGGEDPGDLSGSPQSLRGQPSAT